MDKSGNIFETSKEKVPHDDKHTELAQRLWGLTTEQALNCGMVRVVLYKGNYEFDFRGKRTISQQQACRDMEDTTLNPHS